MNRILAWRSDGDEFATVAGIARNAAVRKWMGEIGAPTPSEPVRMRAVFDERGELPISDFPYTGLPQPKMLSDRARDALSNYLGCYGEYCSAEIEGIPERFWLWKPSIIAACLDEGRSVVYESLSGYRKLVEAVFDADSVPENRPFVVSGFEQQDVWVSEQFSTIVQNAKLTGASLAHVAQVMRE